MDFEKYFKNVEPIPDNVIIDTEKKLVKYHKSKLYNFKPFKALIHELPEQIFSFSLIRPTDCVLEVGCSIGRNTCLINSLLNDSSQHLAVEPNILEANKLKENKDRLGMSFHIGEFAISNTRLMSKGWYTRCVNRKIPRGWREVTTKKWDTVISDFNLNFNVIIADCEGSFVQMIKDFPEMLNNIRLISIEHDFSSEEDLTYFCETLTSKGFICRYKYMKDTKHAPSQNRWRDGVRTDPVFVSAWVKI